ncbi:MAG: SGNH/GDSL hydrolase family protein [Myxococcota bacterium]
MPTLAVALLVALGVMLGRHLAFRDLHRSISQRHLGDTLARVLEAEYADQPQPMAEVRAEFARAYLDPERAAIEMGEYSWDVPTVPAPFVGSAPAPGRHGNATINSQHFRRAGEVAMPKPSGVVRIFVTGGSAAYGSGAPSGDRTIPGFLAAALERELRPRTGRHYEVINAASPAWSTTQERILIENRLSELAPDLVVSLSGSNDVYWGSQGRNVLWFRTLADEHYFSLLDLIHRRTGFPPLPNAIASGGESGGPPIPVPPRIVTQRLVKNLRLAASALAQRGVPYVFALQPTLATTGKSLSAHERLQKDLGEGFSRGSTDYFARAYRAIDTRLSKLRMRNFHYLDLADVFDADEADQEIFLDRFHFGDRGNQRIAGRLHRELLPILSASE